MRLNVLRWMTVTVLFMGLFVYAPASMAGKDNIVVALPDVLVGLDYYQTTARVNIMVGFMIYDPLLERDAKTGDLKPHLVTSWKTVDPTTWEFKLRPGVNFHNGNPFNAECIRFTVMEQVLDPEQKSPQLANYNWIKEVKVVDDLTFQIVTHKPYPLVLQRLNTLFPYDPKWTKEVVAKNGKTYLANNAMGTGPFKLVKFVSRDVVELVRNDTYWKPGVPSFPKLTVRTIPEDATRLAELVKGTVDDAYITPDMIPLVKKDPKLRVEETPILRIMCMQFDNMGRAPGSPKELQDPRVRKAIWHAIDRKTLVQQVVPGLGQYLNVPINPAAFGADPGMPAPEYDPERAKALMKEAGAEKGFTTTIWSFDEPTSRYYQACMPYLEKINVKLQLREFIGRYGEFAKMWQGGKCDGIASVNWGSYNIFDADAVYSYFFMMPDAVLDYTNDKEVSDWVRAARETLDQSRRKELYRKVQAKIIDQAYWVPLWVQNAILGVNKRFQYEMGRDQVPRWQYGKWVD